MNSFSRFAAVALACGLMIASCNAATVDCPAGTTAQGSVDVSSRLQIAWLTDCDAQTVEITMTPDSTIKGWMAIGFHPKSETGGLMVNSDIIMGKVGTSSIEDRFATDFVAPVEDTLPNIESKSHIGSAMRFTRKFDTGDAAQDVILNTDEYTVIYAYNANDADFSAAHTGKGSSSQVNFFANVTVVVTTTTPAPGSSASSLASGNGVLSALAAIALSVAAYIM